MKRTKKSYQRLILIFLNTLLIVFFMLTTLTSKASHIVEMEISKIDNVAYNLNTLSFNDSILIKFNYQYPNEIRSDEGSYFNIFLTGEFVISNAAKGIEKGNRGFLRKREIPIDQLIQYQIYTYPGNIDGRSIFKDEYYHRLAPSIRLKLFK